VVRFDEKFTSPVFFEGPTVTGNISWLWWRTVLCVMILWEQFFSLMVHHPISPVMFVPFWTENFLIVV
jgi:hypothetical protein